MPRFFVEKIADPSVLSAEESRHARRALRLRAGDRVTVFDAVESWTGEIESLEGLVRVKLLERLPKIALPDVRIAAAVPKGGRLDWMIEKLGELGVVEFIPVRFARSVAGLGEAKRKRLENLAKAAAKQSGAPIMKIAEERPVAALPQDAILASPGHVDPLPPGSALVIVGPEGGVAPDEEARFARRCTLGPSILRIETAAVVAAVRLLS